MAVVEVGLGGTWDCTNIVHAAVSVVTNISYDHTEVLGPTLEDIARDKAGIFTAGGRAVVGETDPTLVALFRTAADAGRLSGVLGPGRRVRLHLQPGGRGRPAGRPAHSRRPPTARCSCRCTASHQGDNAACAVAAAEAFFGSPLPEDVVEEGWPRCGCRVASRSSAATRWCWSTAPTTPRG